MPTLSDQLRLAQRRAKRLAKDASRVKALESEVADLKAQLDTALQSAADQHLAMARQDHVHAEEVAAFHAKLDRLLAAFDAVLKRAGMPIAPVAGKP